MLQEQDVWVQIWAPPLISCVFFGQLLNLSVLWFPHLQSEASSIYTIGCFED